MSSIPHSREYHRCLVGGQPKSSSVISLKVIQILSPLTKSFSSLTLFTLSCYLLALSLFTFFSFVYPSFASQVQDPAAATLDMLKLGPLAFQGTMCFYSESSVNTQGYQSADLVLRSDLLIKEPHYNWRTCSESYKGPCRVTEAGEFPWSMLGEKAIFVAINLNSNIFKGYSKLDSSFFERACEI